ncbi:MAG: bifunctional heptose 7-phosphate kinase/heptose 1-phosphate adenyltransferase, partial [Streptosporangiaceae bacterium]|nr:bifunctional heptose 7-phosphate kinase/heptose 1-phosphate adenyltransferase [Streptosporangiaceae bacterium]
GPDGGGPDGGARALGDGIVLIAPFGSDPASGTVRDMLPGMVTVIPLPLDGALQEKTRIRVGGRTLLRVDRPAATPGPAGAEAADAIAAAGAVLVSDYGHGTTRDPVLRDALASRAARAPVVWDPHPRGATPVPGTWLATPNEGEATAAAGAGGVLGGVLGAAEAAERLLGIWPSQAVAVTLGSRGALLARPGHAPLAIPATPIGATDPCGAGDRFAVAVAAALREGALLSEAVTWGVAAATRYLAEGGVNGPAGPRGRQAAEVSGSVPPGGVLVATGGCFDVLHAGHVSMLRAARSLGDSLVVCLNSDASVRRLKGPGRPLNTAADRAAVLAALDCVDEVLIFDEDTPERLLSEIMPAIWVKGGDYDGRELPEAAALRRWNGRVVTVPYLAGRSTTAVLARGDSATRGDDPLEPPVAR